MAKKWPPPTCWMCKRPFDSGQWYRGSRACKPCELAYKEQKRRSRGIKRCQKTFRDTYRAKPVRYLDEWTRSIKAVRAKLFRTGGDEWHVRCNAAIGSLQRRDYFGKKECKNNSDLSTWNETILRSMFHINREVDKWDVRLTNAINLLGKRTRLKNRRQVT